MKKEMTYALALEELKAITEEMEQGLIGVDDLTVKVARSAELIAFCKQKLYESELKVKSIIEGMKDKDSDIS